MAPEPRIAGVVPSVRLAARGETFEAIEGARGVAALLVALFHYPFTDSLSRVSVIRQGWTAVDLFFVMSGFIMAMTYRDRLRDNLERRQFFLKRIGRLYPLHLLTLFAAIIAPPVVHAIRESLRPFGFATGTWVRTGPVIEWSALLSNLLLVQALGVHDHLTFNTPAWSISTEFWTYAVFAATCAAVSARNRELLWGLLAVLGAAVIVMQERHASLNITYDFGFFRCLLGFFLGALAASFRLSVPAPRTGTLVATQLVAFAAFLVIVTVAARQPGLTFVLPLVYVPVVFTLSYDRGLFAGALRTAPMRWLGTLSYSIYMVHEGVLLFVISPIRDHAPVLFGTDVRGAISFAVLVLAVSTGTYRWVEAPARRWFRRIAA